MNHLREVLPAGVATVPASAWSGAWQAHRPDAVAEEVPVALVFNGVSHAVMMASPTDLDDFALGFGLTEGLLPAADDLYGVEAVPVAGGLELRLEVSAACAWALRERRRSLAGRTGCGLCGTDSLTQVRRTLPPVAAVAVAPEAVQRAEAALRPWQSLQQWTGATHAAAWADLQGHIVQVREDVGRHNALDKLVGALVRAGVSPETGFVLITSRASFEMVQKAQAWGAGLLAAVSAPTALAVDCARDANLGLVGFVRPGSLKAYTYPERLGLANENE